MEKSSRGLSFEAARNATASVTAWPSVMIGELAVCYETDGRFIDLNLARSTADNTEH